jgi:hypothetical protein
VESRAGLNDLEKKQFLTLPGLEPRPFSRPARSQSLYRQRNPGSDDTRCTFLLPKNIKCRMMRKYNGQFEINIIRQKTKLSRDWHTSGKRIRILQLKWTNICFQLHALVRCAGFYSSHQIHLQINLFSSDSFSFLLGE